MKHRCTFTPKRHATAGTPAREIFHVSTSFICHYPHVFPHLTDEKKAIARTYLEPQARSDAGVPAGSVSVTDTAMKHLIDEYCREAGVRNLKKHLEKVRVLHNYTCVFMCLQGVLLLLAC